jgi:hypothetical protein
MANLKGLLDRVKDDKKNAELALGSVAKLETDISALETKGKDAIKFYSEKYPDASTATIDDVNKKLKDIADSLETTSFTLQQKIDQYETTLSGLESSAESGYSDVTSKKLLSDYSDEYRVAYVVVWFKVIAVVFIVYQMYSRKNLLFVAATAVAVVIVWYTWTFVQNFFTGLNPSGGNTEKGRLCADGVTEADATGSNCSTCPTKGTPAPYKACKETPFGCCADGLPSTTSDMMSCAPSMACRSSLYGCCPDQTTAKIDVQGSNCDYKMFSSSCMTTTYGCCPNGMVKEDADGSNCSLVNFCGFGSFGCCPDGSFKSNAAGSNCQKKV